MVLTSTLAARNAWNTGSVTASHFRKVPSQASTAGCWVDLSMSPGWPVAQYYANTPYLASALASMRGMYHGVNQSPATKYIVDWGLETPTANLVGQYKLLDYLLYYPFIDLSVTDYQSMDNLIADGAAQLTRYTSGQGVQVMFVCQGNTSGNGTFTFDYINQSGNQVTSPVQYCYSGAANISTLITGYAASLSGGGPFCNLLNGDTGVQQIVGYQQIVGDGGLGCLVMVMPLAELCIREISTTSESVFLGPGNSAPVVMDGAYLNLIMQCAGSVAAGTLSGTGHIIWG